MRQAWILSAAALRPHLQTDKTTDGSVDVFASSLTLFSFAAFALVYLCNFCAVLLPYPSCLEFGQLSSCPFRQLLGHARLKTPPFKLTVPRRPKQYSRTKAQRGYVELHGDASVPDDKQFPLLPSLGHFRLLTPYRFMLPRPFPFTGRVGQNGVNGRRHRRTNQTCLHRHGIDMAWYGALPQAHDPTRKQTIRPPRS